jgi:hypothetical protein
MLIVLNLDWSATEGAFAIGGAAGRVVWRCLVRVRRTDPAPGNEPVGARSAFRRILGFVMTCRSGSRSGAGMAYVGVFGRA